MCMWYLHHLITADLRMFLLCIYTLAVSSENVAIYSSRLRASLSCGSGVEVLPKHRDVWIKYGEGFFVIFLRRLVSFVHRAAEGSLGLGAEGKMGYAVWGWCSSWAGESGSPEICTSIKCST